MRKNNQQPLITIGITCYNAADTIARAVGSALAQDWPALEVLVVDDCSTDGSVAVAQAAVKGHDNARLICHEVNKGPAGARQTIVENAKGAFLAFFDDDDESLPERVRNQYERIMAHEQEVGAKLVACYASGTRLYPNGYQVDLQAIGSRPIVPHGPGMADYLMFYGKKPGWFYGTGTPSCSLMARKSTFDEVGGFDPSFRRVEDVDFAVRLALAGGHFIGCPEKLFIQHATQGGDKAPAKNMEAEIQLAEKHKAYLQSVGRYEYARRWPLVRYYHFQGEHGKMFWALMKVFVRHPFKVAGHFLQTGPRRLMHEIKMRKKQ